jgi:putative lumazine-binding protein
MQMTRWLFLAITLLLLAIPTAAQQETNADREAVRQAVLDYVEGIYNVQPERIERSVSPNLAKLGFYRPPTETTYRPGRNMAFQQLVEIAKNFNKDGKLPKDAPKEITIYDVLDQTATVKLTADWGTDYMHLAKMDGKWMIVNVLWQSHPPKK